MPRVNRVSSKKASKVLWLVILACTQTLFSYADDTDIYVGQGSVSNTAFLMLALDYRQDLSGPYCRANGSASSRCVNLLNTPATFTFLQSLDAQINGIPSGPSDGDADGDGLRDSASDMSNFEASKIQALIAVARAVFEDMSGVSVGLMISNEDSGGTILRGYKPFLENDTNNAKQEIIDILLNLPMPNTGNAYHESQPKEMHYEWFRYINGGAVIYGNQTANNFNGSNSPAPDPLVFNGSSYRSPFTSIPTNFECSSFYEVYITSGNETGTDSDLSTEITNDMSSDAASSFEDMVEYMSDNDLLLATDGVQSLKTWFIQIGNSAAHADDWAEAAGTDDEYMVISGNANELVQIQTTLQAVFQNATEASATFVSSSIPTNVFNRANSLEDFYISLFEPTTTARWDGNVKKFRINDLDQDNDFDNVVDVNGVKVFDQDDGQIVNNALSYWTLANDLPDPDLEKGEVDNRDGRTVARGGAGQRIPGFLEDNVGLTNAESRRQLFVEPSSGSIFEDFDADEITATELQSLLGASDIDAATNLIAWARGVDVDDEDNDSEVDDVRPWLIGSPLHSRPLPINYGTTGGYSVTNPNVRIFFSTNSGFFHVLRNTTTSGAQSGEEVFSFIPRELLGNLQDLRNNATSSQIYGMDGEPVALVVDHDGDANISGSDEVYIYTGMRRGGKSYYALDASNPSANPTLKWKITKTSGGDFDELGYTFSTPKVAKVRYENAARDVLIFGGGFDLNKDGSAGSIARGPDAEGNAIYIVDARTGSLIWKVTGVSGSDSNTVLREEELTHSIPSSIAVLDGNGNGVIDRLYVGDTGSVVWRVDLPEGEGNNHRRDNWTITKLGNFWEVSGSQDRRFFHPPDIVQTKDDIGSYDGIVIASGDRANPTETRDNNYIFYIKDRNIRSGLPPTPTSQAEGVYSIDDLADTTTCVSSACTILNYSNGWKIELNGRGEKGLSTPLVANGKLFYTTYLPRQSTNSCSAPEGSGLLNIVNLKDGTASFNNSRSFTLGPGIPPSVTALEEDSVVVPSTGVIDPFDPTASDTEKVKVLQVGGKSMYILYWSQPGMDSL